MQNLPVQTKKNQLTSLIFSNFILFVVKALILTFAWNWTLPVLISGITAITFGQAFVLLIVVSVLKHSTTLNSIAFNVRNIQGLMQLNIERELMNQFHVTSMLNEFAPPKESAKDNVDEQR